MYSAVRFLVYVYFLPIITITLLSSYCFGSTTGSSSSSSSSGTTTLCLETEKQALLNFKQDLIFGPANRLSSWTGDECCRWPGIVCDNSTGHVIQIRLRNPYSYSYTYPYPYVYFSETKYKAYKQLHELSGKINPSLLNLKDLRHLDLSCNNFSGSHIPSFIGSIESLRYLNLSYSVFGGKIPHQLGNLSMMHCLDLRGNGYISGDKLQWLSGLRSLQYLDMSAVDLSKAMDWVQVTSTLPSLIELHLFNCGLGDISPSITNINFTSLSVLDLSYNYKLKSTTSQWIFSLPSLVSLVVSDCSLYGPLPSALRNMTSLRVLHYDYNYNFSIPNWFYSLTHLEDISFIRNELHGAISDDIGNLTSLTSLDLSANQLQGKIPKSIGKLCNLEKVRLSENNFGRAEIDKLLGSFSKCMYKRLEVLWLDSANLIGHFPEVLCNFQNLAYLSLYNNSISGPIPTPIGRLRYLKYLDLSDNQLNGTLPKSFGQLAMLEELVISGNLLEGVVTNLHFANLTSLDILHANGLSKVILKVREDWVPPFQLKYFSLAFWQLGPRFPLWLKSQQNLGYLDISNAKISDFIPTWFWGKISKMEYLNLSSNGIYGKIPRGIKCGFDYPVIDLSLNNFTGALPPGTFSEAIWLDLSDNSFSGSIHHFLCDEPNMSLRILNLGKNLLSGIIPDCWDHKPYLEHMMLDNNNLEGYIPNSIGHLSWLQSLHLRHNNLSGKLPQSICYCSNLVVVDLSWNKFTGRVPAWMGKSFPSLMDLNLRSNRFHGEIPNELCHLYSLQILDLAHNNFSGLVPKCFINFSAMMEIKNRRSNEALEDFFGFGTFTENGFLVTKGREAEYRSNLKLVASMDLSTNNFSGEIPEGLTRLVGLRSLNLSQNHFTGSIPINIGDMKVLESLDFSLNRFSGEIPSSMSSLTFLSRLNLSYNKLTGHIPTSTQLQSFDESSFVGNMLCGSPLAKCYAYSAVPKIDDRDEEGDEYLGIRFLGSMALGFVVGFWAVVSPMLFSTSWRRAYFRMLSSIWYKLSESLSYFNDVLSSN